jgi:hypothetical protein
MTYIQPLVKFWLIVRDIQYRHRKCQIMKAIRQYQNIDKLTSKVDMFALFPLQIAITETENMNSQ